MKKEYLIGGIVTVVVAYFGFNLLKKKNPINLTNTQDKNIAEGLTLLSTTKAEGKTMTFFVNLLTKEYFVVTMADNFPESKVKLKITKEIYNEQMNLVKNIARADALQKLSLQNT